MKKCLFCDHELQDEALSCDICKSPQKGRPCDVCKKRMPESAKICNACKSYRNRHLRWLGMVGVFLAPVATAIGVLSGAWTLYNINRDSDTRFRPVGSNDEYIFVKVWNVGKKPSVLQEYRLRFGPYADQPQTLVLATDDVSAARNVVKGEDFVTLKLSGGTFQLPGTEAYERLMKGNVTLEIDVEESNDPGWFRAMHRRHVTIPAKRIEAFIKSGMKVTQ